MVDQLWLFILGKGTFAALLSCLSHLCADATDLSRSCCHLLPRALGTSAQGSSKRFERDHGRDERQNPAFDQIRL